MDAAAQPTPEPVSAIARVLETAAAGAAEPAVREVALAAARELFGVRDTGLYRVDPGMRLLVTDTGRPIAFSAVPAVTTAIDHGGSRVELGAGPELAALLAGAPAPARGLALLLRAGAGPVQDVLLLADGEPARVADVATGLASAFAAALHGALAQVRMARALSRRADERTALTRAATALNEDLDLETISDRVAQEAARLVGADVVAVYSGSSAADLTVAGAHRLPPESIGTFVTEQTLAGRAVARDRPLLTNDYERVVTQASGSPFRGVRAAIAVPMHWDGALRGAISAGFRARTVTDDELNLLTAFTELASLACRNATAHAGLRRAARTDALTGLLNHAALHEGLRTEIDRARRADAQLSLVLLDLDEFKQVNDRFGHLVGDEVLRRAGFALRQATRPYDLAARYGGDEFAIVAAEADEAAAADIAMRAIEQITAALDDIGDVHLGGATAGVAEWTPSISATELIARADRALLHGKGEGLRGIPVAFSAVPDSFRPGRFRRPGADRSLPEAPPMPPGPLPDRDRDESERLRKRTRQLTLASDLGARLSGMTDPDAICAAAVDELGRAFGYALVATVHLRGDGTVYATAGSGTTFERLVDRTWEQPADSGVIGRCIASLAPVLIGDVREDPHYRYTNETADVRSEVTVPLWSGEELWGVLNVEDTAPHAFDEDDVRILQTVASQVGGALHSATLYERLERAYLGTAQALAAALEAKDAYTAEHAQSIVEVADRVGRRLGMADDQLRDLRFGAAFHDIGKIAVPEAILRKAGPLTPEERSIMQRHTVVGEQILAPVEFLAGVRPLVRHEHERWDGEGYPDGLAGEAIPLGARIILACDAYHAMTSDRPYRAALGEQAARGELERHAGTQFDPQVVAALLAVLAEGSDPAP